MAPILLLAGLAVVREFMLLWFRGAMTLRYEIHYVSSTESSRAFCADSQRLNRQGTGSASTGASNKEIGERLCISLATVNTHIINSYPKPGVFGRVEAWRKRGSRGFISGKGQRLIPAHAGYESLFVSRDAAMRATALFFVVELPRDTELIG